VKRVIIIGLIFWTLVSACLQTAAEAYETMAVSEGALVIWPPWTIMASKPCLI
jgi:hypothetical protein